MFITRYNICQHEKGRNQNARLYTPLPIPNRPWESRNLDIVLGLSKTQQGYNSIMVLVDYFTKMVHFIPFQKTSDAMHVAQLLFLEIFRLHGLTKSIMSDRDVKFTGHFW